MSGDGCRWAVTTEMVENIEKQAVFVENES
jgi:hypothetical protein